MSYSWNICWFVTSGWQVFCWLHFV
jgi:hypothetical protein